MIPHFSPWSTIKTIILAQLPHMVMKKDTRTMRAQRHYFCESSDEFEESYPQRVTYSTGRTTLWFSLHDITEGNSDIPWKTIGAVGTHLQVSIVNFTDHNIRSQKHVHLHWVKPPPKTQYSSDGIEYILHFSTPIQ